MQNILYKNSWINYLDKFHLSYNMIDYPKNMYFAANIIDQYLKSNNTLYNHFPYAEKFDVSTFKNIDWKNAIITFDKYSKIIIAPEPVKKLINLIKRLDSKEAENNIFKAFIIPIINIKSFAFIVICMIIIIFIKLFIYFDLFYRFKYF